MKRDMTIGQTDYSAFVFIPDPASTDGSGKTGLVAANLTVSGARMETDNDATVIDYTSSLNDLAALTTAHTDWGLKEISSTLAPGLYRLDIADALFATGAWTCVVYVMITSSAAAASPMEFNLVTGTVLLTNGTGTGQVKLSSGYISPNWGDVGNPTTTVDLSGTTTAVVGTVTDAATMLNVENAVWDAAKADHNTADTMGLALGTASAATNPWEEPTTGYAAGTFGDLISTNLNATIGSRSTYAGGDTAGVTTLLSRISQALNYSVSGRPDVNVTYVNEVAINGAGTEASPWGP